MSQEFLRKQREALLAAISKSEVLTRLYPHSTFKLSRKPYTGDYHLQEKSIAGWYPVAKFGMLPLPGCRAICVLHHVEVEPSLRGKGIGKELLRIRLAVAKEIGYKIVMATVRDDNEKEIHLLAANGVMHVLSYLAPDELCGHMVQIRMRTL